MKLLLLSLGIVIVAPDCNKQKFSSPALIFYDQEDRTYFSHPLLDSIYYASTNTGIYAIDTVYKGLTRDRKEWEHKVEAYRMFKRFMEGHGRCACRLLTGKIEVIPGSDMNKEEECDTTLRVVFTPNIGYW